MHLNAALNAILRLAAVVVCVALLATAGAFAHPELERASPAPDAVLGAPPSRIDLWMTEPVAVGAGSPELSVLDESGNQLAVRNLGVDASDPRHLSADLVGLGYGTFTVEWTARSDADGHTLTGTYAFRVGGTSRAPGAATVEGKRPQPWAVATRWLTFLGAGLAAASLLFDLIVLRPGESDLVPARRRLRLGAFAAGLGLLATLAEPLMQSAAPAAGLIAPSLGDAIRGLPGAWYLRAPGLLIAGGVALLLSRAPERLRSPFAIAGGAAAMAAILGLALTSHASARESWRLPAVLAIVIHQWAVALWVGGLAMLAVSPPWRGEDRPPAAWLRRFSWLALALAAAGIVSGVINAGLVLPSRDALLDSDYGHTLLVKVALVLVALALAAVHRLAIHRAVPAAARAMRRSIPAEAVVLLVVVLGGSILALLAPPTVSKGLFDQVDLAAPMSADANGLYARLVIDPAAQGGNDIGAAITQGVPISVGPDGKLRSAPMIPDIALVRLSLTNLERQTAPTVVDLFAMPDGWFRVNNLALGLDGWWRADILVRRLGVEDVTIPFYFILPDPNVHGEGAVPVPADDPDARAVFERGLAGLTGLHSVHFVERLSGGTGTAALSDHTTHDGTQPNQPAALRIASSDFEMVRIGGFQWVREDGEAWTRTDAGPVVPPSAWGTDYQSAVGLRIGGHEMVGDRPATIVTFSVPSEQFADAWYAWWVDDETGHILRETMVSRGHYMLRDFDQFDAAPPVTAPEPADTGS